IFKQRADAPPDSRLAVTRPFEGEAFLARRAHSEENDVGIGFHDLGGDRLAFVLGKISRCFLREGNLRILVLKMLRKFFGFSLATANQSNSQYSRRALFEKCGN